jgi:transcriptional regulator with XRE-family HTH domain
MAVNASPPAARRLVGSALRRYRESLGYTLDDVGQTLSCDRSKVSRIETGQRGITCSELQTLLAEYGADNPTRQMLTVIAGQRVRRGWWQKYADIVPTARTEYLALESVASQISCYEVHRIPELLQTEAYAQTLAAAVHDLAVAATSAEVVLARQQAARQSDTAIQVIIGEAALRTRVGGTSVMADQFAALARPSRAPITIQVLPFSATPQANGTGSLTLLRFAPACTLGIAHLDDPAGGRCLEDADALASCTRVFEQLKESALSPADSARLITRLAR